MVPCKRYLVRCSVPGCKDKTSPRHRFPLQPAVLKIWLERINNPMLSNISIEYIRKSHLVCHRHFSEECYRNVKANKLKMYSLPTLLLPNFKENPAENSFFVQLAVRKGVPIDHSYHIPTPKNVTKIDTKITAAEVLKSDKNLKLSESDTSSLLIKSNNIIPEAGKLSVDSTCGEVTRDAETDVLKIDTRPTDPSQLEFQQGSTLQKNRTVLVEVSENKELVFIPKYKYFSGITVEVNQNVYDINKKYIRVKLPLKNKIKIEEPEVVPVPTMCQWEDECLDSEDSSMLQINSTDQMELGSPVNSTESEDLTQKKQIHQISSTTCVAFGELIAFSLQQMTNSNKENAMAEMFVTLNKCLQNIQSSE